MAGVTRTDLTRMSQDRDWRQQRFLRERRLQRRSCRPWPIDSGYGKTRVTRLVGEISRHSHSMRRRLTRTSCQLVTAVAVGSRSSNPAWRCFAFGSKSTLGWLGSAATLVVFTVSMFIFAGLETPLSARFSPLPQLRYFSRWHRQEATPPASTICTNPELKNGHEEMSLIPRNV